MERVKFQIIGTVSGFKNDSESEMQSIGRLGFNAEQNGNTSMESRIHIQELKLPATWESIKFCSELLKKINTKNSKIKYDENSFEEGFNRAYHWMLVEIYKQIDDNYK